MISEIETFLNDIIESEKEFNTKKNKSTDEFNSLIEKLNSELSVLDEAFKLKDKELHSEMSTLNAEIDRYGKLLKHFYEDQGMSNEMKNRFEKLKMSIEEYISARTKSLSNKYEKEKQKISDEINIAKEEMSSLSDVEKEEDIARLKKMIEEYEKFLLTSFESYKGTCKVSNLKEFETPSFDHLTDSILIGNKKINIKLHDYEKEISVPYITKFIDSKNLLLIYDNESDDRVEAISDVLIFRILFSHVPDKIKIHLFDRNMNKKFKEFLPISEKVISKGFEFEHFTQELSKAETIIRSKLNLVWSDVESEHQSLFEYNLKMIQQEKYDEIVPYFLFVIDDLQDFVQDSYGLKSVLQRLENLTNYGCNALFLIKNNDNDAKINELIECFSKNNFEHIDVRSRSTKRVLNDVPIQEIEIENMTNEDKKIMVNNFNLSLKNLESSRAKIKFKSYAVPSKNQWFTCHSYSEVSAPIGKSMNSDGFEHIFFKTKDMLSNALLCGGVGSGKTNFLKSLITSLSLNYSPEELEFWLVDMKNGAGFSIFHNLNLPHATKYAFSAENELINDLFLQLNIEMDRRYATFGAYNIDNLVDAAKSNAIPKQNIPRRIILIIDEFASIFTEDAPFLDEISSNLLSIVQKGRAMGVNILLAAQNFDNIRNGSFSQATTLIPCRILLKSSPNAAQSILGHSNKGYTEITRIGEGLINNNFGEINSDGGNAFFKSFLLDNDDLEPILKDIQQECVSTNLNTNNVRFIDSSLPADFNHSFYLNNNYSSSIESFRKKGVQCFIGESYLLDEDNHFDIQWKINGRQNGQNILICGNEREYSLESLFSIISSLTYGMENQALSIQWLNALDKEYSEELKLTKLENELNKLDFQDYSIDEIERLIYGIQQLIELRRASDDRTPVLVFLLGIEKIVKLNNSNYSDSNLSEIFNSILTSGSNYGIYFVLETTKPSNLNKISTDILSYIEHRICYHLSQDESMMVINNKLANQLINSGMSSIRNKAIYFSQSMDDSFKFKSYSNAFDHEKLINPNFIKGNKLFHIELPHPEQQELNDSDISISLGEVGDLSLDSFSEFNN